MASMFSALVRTTYAMKNTIDDADYIIDFCIFIVIFQYVMKYSYSHSIVAGGFDDTS